MNKSTEIICAVLVTVFFSFVLGYSMVAQEYIMKPVITMNTLNEMQREYTALIKVSQPGADLLDRIGYLEQYFDMIDLGEILISDEGYEYA